MFTCPLNWFSGVRIRVSNVDGFVIGLLLIIGRFFFLIFVIFV